MLAEGVVGSESPNGPLHASVCSQAEDIWMSLLNNMSPDRSEVIYMHLGISAIKFRTVYTQTMDSILLPANLYCCHVFCLVHLNRNPSLAFIYAVKE